MGVDAEVTTFTCSDFGRAYKSNGSGTDHGWGSCHFVLGGAVRGGDFYGQWPNLELGGPSDSGTLGRVIPTTSVEEYAQPLARWYGVPDHDLEAVFPNMRNFSPRADLGFLG
jgi:uncharacterized protein (DUF1501 family)